MPLGAAAVGGRVRGGRPRPSREEGECGERGIRDAKRSCRGEFVRVVAVGTPGGRTDLWFLLGNGHTC